MSSDELQFRLTRGEYLRICALDRALGSIQITATMKPNLQKLLSDAEAIESWLKKAEEPKQ